MEKQSTNLQRHWRNRLLVFFLLYCGGFLFSADFYFTETTPTNTALTRSFLLEIPRITPSRIQAEEPVFEDGIFVIEYKKIAGGVQGSQGTHIFLVLQFEKPGRQQLKNIRLTIDENNTKYACFPPIVITQDKIRVMPVAFFSIKENPVQGKKSDVYVWVQNCLTVRGLQNSLTTDALFELGHIKKELPYTMPTNIDVPANLALYSYLPLENGLCTIPAVHLALTAFNGEKVTIETEPFHVSVAPAKIINKTPEQKPLIREDIKVTKTPSLYDKQDIQRIADREGEKQRILHIYVQILFFIAFVFTVLTVVLAILKRKQKRLFLALALFSILGVCLLCIPATKSRVVCLQTDLQTIPELSAGTRGVIEPGTIAYIKRKSDTWYLIELDENRSGWIPCEKCIDIK
ncbi:MAG TPA: hypothetical protein VFC68_01535 [Treponemataceae bacterium]|nr:hypothetical protein [Treponemataceae bacterium]